MQFSTTNGHTKHRTNNDHSHCERKTRIRLLIN